MNFRPALFGAAKSKLNLYPKTVVGVNYEPTGRLDRVDAESVRAKRALHGLSDRQVIAAYLPSRGVIDEIGPPARFVQRAQVLMIAPLFFERLIPHDHIYVAWSLRVRMPVRSALPRASGLFYKPHNRCSLTAPIVLPFHRNNWRAANRPE